MLVTQSCQTLCNPMDCSPPGPSFQGIFQVRIQGGLRVVCYALLQGILLTQGSNPRLSLSFSLSLKIFIYLFIYLLFVNSKVDMTKCQEIGLNQRWKYLRKRVKICSAE